MNELDFLQLLLEPDYQEIKESNISKEGESNKSKAVPVEDIQNIYLDYLNKNFNKIKTKNIEGKTITTDISYIPGDPKYNKVENGNVQFSIIINRGQSGESAGSKIKRGLKSAFNTSSSFNSKISTSSTSLN